MKDIRTWPCIVFWSLLYLLYAYWTWSYQLNDLGGDSAVYLLMAQHWSPFGVTNPAAAQFASATSFPPLYPLLLAFFAGGDSWLIAHQLTTMCGIASLFFLWRCLRVSGFPLPDSLIAIAIIAFIPGFYTQALYIHSEFLFLLFISLCLYSVLLLEKVGGIGFVVLASLAAAGACLTRSAGASLVVALFVYVLICRPKREWGIVLLLAIAPVMIWMQLWQPAGGGYWTAWNERLGIVGSPSVAEILAAQFAALTDAFQQNFAGQGSANTAGVFLISVACAATWLCRLWQRKLDALFIGAYFAILLVWPFPAERVRLLLPAVPILVVYMLLALYELKLARAGRTSNIAARVALVVLTITLLPALVLTVQRHLEPMPEEMEALRHSPEWYGGGSQEARLTALFLYQRRLAGYEELSAHVPLGACIYSIKPSLVALFAGRNSYRSPLPDSLLGKALDPNATQCRYVHMVSFSSPTFGEPFYPLARWKDGIEVIHATRYVSSDEGSPLVGVLARIR